MDSPIYSDFNISTTPYKVVNGQEIALYVLLPKTVTTGKRPILVHFHGGYLVVGDALFPDWSAKWARDYTRENSAIRISANYRLAPESNGPEILSDVHDLFVWIQQHLAGYLKQIGTDITPDLNKILVYGESAGGYLAIQSGLMRPDLVKAVIGAYPMTYIDSPWYAAASEEKHPFGAPLLPKEILDAHLATIEKGQIVTSIDPNLRLPLAISALQHGRFPEILGTEDEIYPARVLEKFSGSEKVPYLFVLHGTEDTAVPYEETVKFAGAWEEKFGKESVGARFLPGEHGFDGEISLETSWLKDNLVAVTKAWLE